MRIVTTVARWELNGVSVFTERLVRELRLCGVNAEILVTDPCPERVGRFPRPDDVPVHDLPVNEDAATPVRWKALKSWLEAHRPCVYVPNGDAMTGAPPDLDDSVRTVGVVHNNRAEDYDLVNRIGARWDLIVAVSDDIARTIKRAHPELASRTETIPHGVTVASELRRPSGPGPLRVVYAGRLVHQQKRVLDIVAAVASAQRLGARVSLTVAGDGSARKFMEPLTRAALRAGSFEFLGALSPVAVQALFARSDVCLLMSDHEGFGLSVLEAMAVGCVPVVSDIACGYREIVRHEENGLVAPPRDVRAFARVLFRVDQDRSLLERLSRQAATSAREHSIERMTDRYLEVFSRALAGRPRV